MVSPRIGGMMRGMTEMLGEGAGIEGVRVGGMILNFHPSMSM